MNLSIINEVNKFKIYLRTKSTIRDLGTHSWAHNAGRICAFMFNPRNLGVILFFNNWWFTMMVYNLATDNILTYIYYISGNI